MQNSDEYLPYPGIGTRGEEKTCCNCNHLPNGPKPNCSCCCCSATVPRWDSACANVRWESPTYPESEKSEYWERQRRRPGTAERHFPAVVTPLSTHFHHSPDLLLPPCSHNRLKINSEARLVPESNGTLADVVAGQFVSRTFSVK